MLNLASGLKTTLIPQGNKQGFSIKDKQMALNRLKAKINGKKYLPFEQDGKTYNLYDMPKGFVIKGTLNLSRKGLTELPDLSEVVIEGNFECHDNQLTSLVGVPQMNKGCKIDCDKSLRNKYGFNNLFSYEQLCASPLYKNELAMSRVRSKLPQEKIETKPASSEQQKTVETKQQQAFEKINAEFSQWLKDNKTKASKE